MTGSKRSATWLVLVAHMLCGATAWSADVSARKTPAVNDASTVDAADEPILVIPKDTLATPPKAASARIEKRTVSEQPVATAPLFVTDAGPAARKAGKPAAHTLVPRDNDREILVVAAEDEAPPAGAKKSTAAPSKSPKTATTYDSSFSGQYEDPSMMRSTPNPGYHPVSTPRLSFGWYFTGSEPAQFQRPPWHGPGEPVMAPDNSWSEPGAFETHKTVPDSGEAIEAPVPEKAPSRASRKSSDRALTATRPATPKPVIRAVDTKPITEKTSTGKSKKPARPPVHREFKDPDEPESLFPTPRSTPPKTTSARAKKVWYQDEAEDIVAEEELVPTPEVDYVDESEPFMPYGPGPMAMDDDGPSLFGGRGGFVPFARPGKKWAFTGGAEVLFLRPHFSQATGITETTTTQIGNSTVVSQNLVNFNPGYQGAFRAYLGMRDTVCGDEIRFAYLHFNSAQSLGATATADMHACDFLCNTTPNPGDSVRTNFGLNMNLWDLDCVRPFYFLPKCQEPCGPECHPWDLRWFVGVRGAYINHNISALVTDATAASGNSTFASAINKFAGVGPRMGIQGRKFFGKTGRASVFARGAGSLLLGNVRQNVLNSSLSSDLPTTTTLVSRNSRIIPVAELEVGATYFVLPRFAVSGGWMLMNFWDLGLQETNMAGLDTSNILGFDGFFVRGELVF